MGAVYLAEHEVLCRSFAVKVLQRELADDPRLCQRFQREARAASRIQHPNIVYISDFGTTDDGSLFLVMEYIPGQSLREELEHGGPLEVRRALRILYQVADALECAHSAGVVHRDLKPDNLLLTEHRGKPDYVKVLDFGVSKIIDPEAAGSVNLSARGELYGTPQYMAPEQFSGQPVSPQTDIYALGVVIYELVTGVTPFQGSLAELLVAHCRNVPQPPSATRPAARLSPALDAIVARCLAKSPRDRYASAGELKAALLGLYRILSGQSGPPARNEDTDHSSPLRHFALIDAGLPSAEVTRQEIAPLAPASDGGRQAFERQLRELAEALRDEGLGSSDLTVALTRLMQADERVFAEQAEIALAEAQIAEVDQTIDERASRLRYASLQLSQERVRMAEATSTANAPTLPLGVANPLGDLDEQVRELESRLVELERERQERVSVLETRRTAHRETLTSWEAKQQSEVDRLLDLVQRARGAVVSGDLVRRYLRLDSLRAPSSRRPALGR